ncbi:MAG: hypothetical protein JSS49_04190 [Planctomycetes bacterium]|nr:hypothetical protein [Planctomycetota bacterium]
MKPLAVLLMLATTVCAGQPTPTESYNLLYLADSGITALQLSVVIDDAGPEASFEKYVDALMKDLDKNSDGVVTVEEARGRLVTAREVQVQLGLPATASPDTSADLSPKDGKISRPEILAHFKRIGLLPFSVRFQPRTSQGMDGGADNLGMAGASTDTPLFQRLDVNADNKLSVEELKNALEVLRKLDRDDDETISIAELQPLAAAPQAIPRTRMTNAAVPPNPFVSVASGESIPKLIRRLVDKYDSADAAKSGVPSLSAKNQKLSAMEVGLAGHEFSRFDVDGDGQLDFTELRPFVTSLEPTLHLLINVTAGKAELSGEATETMRSTADGSVHLQFGPSLISVSATPPAGALDVETLVKPLFTAVDANANGYLEPMEAPDAALSGATFADLDADRNGKLYLEEIVDYMKPRMNAARHRVELTITEQGRTLFDILDTDRDGRLAHREVRSVADKLSMWDKDGDGQLSESEIPLQFRAIAAAGALPNFVAFGASVAGGNPRAPVGTQSSGPIWFRKMDRNSDGEISRREFLGELDLFDKLDLNKDGALELTEAMQARP